MFSFLKNLFGNNKSSELQEAIQRGAVIIDVRSPDEYKQGHVKGSQNIPLNEIKLKSAIIRKWGKPVITVCKSGARSMMAKNTLSAAGVETYNGGPWTSVRNLVG